LTKELNQEEIKKHIIHRYENLMLDSITFSEDQEYSGSLTLSISKNDSLNRNLFLKEHYNNSLVLQTPLLMEILALGSIVVSGTLKPDEMVIFAAISNFKTTAHYKENTTLNGNVSRITAKNSFLKYKGNLHHQDTPIATGDMMAFFTKITHENIPEISDFSPPQGLWSPVKKENRYKLEPTIMADEFISDDTLITSRYTYPATHPLTKGHFPKNPLMMGVMQWMSIEDALCAYLEKEKITGIHNWRCSATIFNQKNHKIADFKDVSLQSWINEQNIPNQVEITETKRINFRNMVKPEDTIYTVITNLEKL